LLYDVTNGSPDDEFQEFNTYHRVQRLSKSIKRTLRYFRSEQASPVRNKIRCHGNVSKGIKSGPDQENSRKYLSFGEKIVKIGPVDPEIICLKFKKEALPASLPSGLNKNADDTGNRRAKPLTQYQKLKHTAINE